MIENILRDLSKERPLFHSEADFQLSLFRFLRRDFDREKIFLEYISGKRKYHIDIVVKDNVDSSLFAIELKYVPKKLFEGCLLAQGVGGKEYFCLKNQGARDVSRYGFWVDVERLQEFAQDNRSAIGYVIFLTNDEKYWDERQSTRETFDHAFKIHEGKHAEGSLIWDVRSKEKRKQVDLGIHYGPLCWKSYSSPGRNKFRYLLVEVKNEKSKDSVRD